MFLLIHTAAKHYAIRRADITQIRSISRPAELAALGTPDRPTVPVELGEFLDPSDRTTLVRRHGLIVPLRRRPIVFLVDRIDQEIEHIPIRPIPPLLARRLHESWVIGVVELNGELIILLDLRSLARSVL